MIRPGFLSLLCLLGLPLVTVAPAHGASKQEELKALQNRIENVKKDLSLTTSTRDEVEKKLKLIEQDIGRNARELYVLDEKIQATNRSLRKLNDQQRDLSGQLDEQQQSLKAQLRAAYTFGRQENLKILLNQQSPATLSRALTYHRYVHEARSKTIHHIESLLAELTEVERDIAEQSQILRDDRHKQAIALDKLKSQRDDRAELVSKLNRDIQHKGSELADLERQHKALENLLSELSRNITDVAHVEHRHQSVKTRRGKLPWPLKGKVLANFGSKYGKQGSLRWKGMLIKGRYGESIRAISHGRVAYSDWFRGFGLLMIIDHGDGFLSLYGHNQSLFKAEGEWVEEGEVIANVGDSGGEDQPALYFELRRDGAPINPRSWCDRKFTVATMR